jgi:hypothetical protein
VAALYAGTRQAGCMDLSGIRNGNRCSLQNDSRIYPALFVITDGELEP